MTASEISATTTKSCCGPTCCGGSSGALDSATDVRTVVREKYGAVAAGERSSTGCCSPSGEAQGVLEQLGYTREQAAAIPEGANLGLGCGNPLAHAGLRAGETVLDLGSGAGIDCFLAAREVGEAGRVIGVDMTPAMVERARANAAKVNATNVEFRLGEIEHLPVADATVDAVISNCVVNLSPDKPRVFREALRALKPGGRMLVSDLVLRHEIGAAARQNVELYVGCIAGAMILDEYLQTIRDAGFRKVEIVEERTYDVGLETMPEGSIEREAYGAVVSVKVRAEK
jgi:SAM-dependent methyltransferase